MENVYASVGISLKEFMAGKNPTTQPGVTVPYYTSFDEVMNNTEYEFDGKDSASCIMMFDVDVVKTKLTPSTNPKILGRGTINPQHIVDAMIQIKQPGRNDIPIDAGKCDWDKARETIQLMQDRAADKQTLKAYERFMDGAIHWNETYDMTPLAQFMFWEYTQQFDSLEMDNKVMRSEHYYDTMLQSFTEVYQQNATLPEAQQIIAGLKAVDEAMQYRSTLQMDADSFYDYMATQPLDSTNSFMQDEANEYAALRLAKLPDDLRDIATNAFNTKLAMVAVERNAELFTAKDITIAVAYAWHELAPHIPNDNHALNMQFVQEGREAYQIALRYGATMDEIIAKPTLNLKTGIPLGPEPRIKADICANDTPMPLSSDDVNLDEDDSFDEPD